MLHVTNGDVAAERIRQAAIDGEILPWRDVLHDGPVPAELDEGALREARARFVAAEGWDELEAARADFEARDRVLAEAEGTVVLWFEHDLYDQLQLLQILDRLADRADEGIAVEAIVTPTYLGMLGPDAFRRLYDLRDDVSGEMFELARTAWEAFRAPDPTLIEDLLAGDTRVLPHLGAALRRHLQEFPDLEAGLSRTERQALEAIAGGARTLREIYHAAHHAREDAVFLGDTAFVTILRRLAEAPDPLLRRRDGGCLRPVGRRNEELLAADLELTVAGRAVLAGETDHVALNGLDRWLGGVHLEGRSPPWRWDAVAGCLVPGP